MADRQTELLEKEDARFYAIDKFNTGLASIATTEKVEKTILSFGLPSTSSLFLNLSLQAKQEIDALDIEKCFDKHNEGQGTYPEDHKLLFDFFELMISQTIFSFSAIEAFANISIPKDYIYRVKRSDKKFIEEYDKDQTERYVSLDNKLDKILPNVFNVKTPSGTKIWDNFQNIKKLRDRLIHLKSSDTTASGPDIKTIWGDLIRNKKVDFTKQAHQIIGHYIDKKEGFRWHKKFPY
jgi:hypothetical protein